VPFAGLGAGARARDFFASGPLELVTAAARVTWRGAVDDAA